MKIQPDALKWPMSFLIVGVMAIVSMVLAQEAHLADRIPGKPGATVPVYAAVVTPNAPQTALPRGNP